MITAYDLAYHLPQLLEGLRVTALDATFDQFLITNGASSGEVHISVAGQSAMVFVENGKGEEKTRGLYWHALGRQLAKELHE